MIHCKNGTYAFAYVPFLINLKNQIAEYLAYCPYAPYKSSENYHNNPPYLATLGIMPNASKSFSPIRSTSVILSL